jgi:hypothetical protein
MSGGRDARQSEDNGSESDHDAASDSREHGQPHESTDDGPTVRELLAATGTLLRGRPALAVPFLLVGLLAAAGDLWRLADSVSTVPQTTAQRGFLHVVLQPTPAPISAVGTRVPAVVGLRTEPLLGVLAADGLPVLAAAVATVVVVARSPGTPTGDRSLGYLLGVAVPALVVYQLVTLAAFQVIARGWPPGLLAYLAIVVLLYVFVRLWLVPATIVTAGPRAAVGRSLTLTKGHGWAVFGLVLLVGVGANLLVSVPVLVPSSLGVPLPVGTALATAVLGSVHAVLLGVVVGRVRQA